MSKRWIVPNARFVDAMAVILIFHWSLVTSHWSLNAASEVGVLVIAHGGSSRWDSMVRKAARQANRTLPTELAIGMGKHPEEARRLQQAVNRLTNRGVRRIAVVPLLVSSHSEVFRQFEYLFGLKAQAEWPQAGKPLVLNVPVAMGKALDDSPLVAEILLERARLLSKRPQEETVILLAHGPNSDEDNHKWLQAMERLGKQIAQQGGFRDVLSLTMRDDGPETIRQQATKQLRAAVLRHGQTGRVLVVPLLIAQGGVELKIPKLLAGLTYRYDSKTLLPHPKLAQWIIHQATQLSQPSSRRS